MIVITHNFDFLNTNDILKFLLFLKKLIYVDNFPSSIARFKYEIRNYSGE